MVVVYVVALIAFIVVAWAVLSRGRDIDAMPTPSKPRPDPPPDDDEKKSDPPDA